MTVKKDESKIKQELIWQYQGLKIRAKTMDKNYELALQTFIETVTRVGYEDILHPEDRIKRTRFGLKRDILSIMLEEQRTSKANQCWRCGTYKTNVFDVCSECGEDE